MFRGTFSGEQGDLHKRWKVVSRRLRDFHNCIVLPIGSLSMGLCRHRAILFKVKNKKIHITCCFFFPKKNSNLISVPISSLFLCKLKEHD
jgi:hypothetical protein